MKRLLVLFAFLIFGSVGLFAQEIPEPTNLMDILTNLGLYLGSFPGMVVLITFVTAIALRYLKKVEGKVMKSLITLAISLLVIIGCNLANYGFVANMTWLIAILNGVGVAICSSLLFSVPIMKQILEWIEGQVKKE